MRERRVFRTDSSTRQQDENGDEQISEQGRAAAGREGWNRKLKLAVDETGRRSVAWHFLQTKTGDESDREWTKSSGGRSDGSRRAQTASVSRESGYLKVAETALQCKHRTDDDGRTARDRRSVPPSIAALFC
uniref:Uncharacterized protein n=1 Tax=Plectus sambesii TaxID=2011161 RepID=A0A914UTX2_9BILA